MLEFKVELDILVPKFKVKLGIVILMLEFKVKLDILVPKFKVELGIY